MSDKRHIHLIGICGTAMASLAGMLKQRGFRVTGSDAAAYPPMSDFLDAKFTCRNVQPACGRACLAGRQACFDRVGEILDTGVCHMAFFSDSEGNALMLHRRYAPHE